MEFTLLAADAAPETLATPCLVAGVFEHAALSPTAARLDRASDGALTRLLRRGDLAGKPGETLMLHGWSGAAAERVLLIGCGAQNALTERNYRKALAAMGQSLREGPVTQASCFLTELAVKDRDAAYALRQAVETLEDVGYRFDRLKTKKNGRGEGLSRVALSPRELAPETATRALALGRAVAAGVRLAKDLGNLPPNICTPGYLADQTRELAQGQDRLQVEVLELADMERLGMGALLSVARGSRQPARLIVAQYRGAAEDVKPVALVGKGVTFDSGGISIKPSANMDEMKFDMCGAASVLGTLRVCLELNLPVNVVGVIPTTENLPDGAASKPGDVITSLSGQTIEVLNTDAEGRLILCDALTYSQRYAPAVIIDIATLTGACVVALGKHPSGLLSNDEELAAALLRAGEQAGDRAWRLPLWDDYQDQLKTNFADMANVGGRDAGAITAACFLARYTEGQRWAHLDIAGTAWKTGDQKGATGRPVPLLAQFLLDRAGVA